MGPLCAQAQPEGAATSPVTGPRVELPALRTTDMRFRKTFRFYSSVLGQERMLFIHLPEGYAESPRTYPVHYVLDGELLFRLVAANVEFTSLGSKEVDGKTYAANKKLAARLAASSPSSGPSRSSAVGLYRTPRTFCCFESGYDWLPRS